MANTHHNEASVFAWERMLANALHRLRLDSIQRKVLVFSLLATLIPSLTIGWLFYVYANRLLTEKVAKELQDVTGQNVRELDLWLKERLYQVRVFSSSYEVSENLDKITRADSSPGAKALAFRRLNDYLKSVRGKFVDYEELVVVNPKTQPIATSARQIGPVSFPPDWQQRAKADTPTMGSAYRDQALGKMVMVIAVPIKAQSGRFLGALAVKLNFDAVDDILSRSSLGNTGQSALIAQDGTVIAGRGGPPANLANAKPASDSAAPSAETAPVLLEYADARGGDVVGVLRPMSQLDWGVVAQIAKEEVYARAVWIRSLTLAICAGLLLAIGLGAYVLVLTIVRPLERLADGAAKVAAGDLQVQLPAISRGEVGYVTEAFNAMVTGLRRGQEELTEKNKELQALSITDSLTGLHNRKHFMDVLTSEVARAARGQHQFSVAMIDADRFKEYNDTLGHQAGDALLRHIGVIFIQSLRTMDCAARYGGDEFILLLPEAGVDKAVEVAERIRERVAEAVSRTGARVAVTVSIGVAAFPAHGETPDALVASADSALYQAKRNGRNRLVVAGRPRQPGVEVTG